MGSSGTSVSSPSTNESSRSSTVVRARKTLPVPLGAAGQGLPYARPVGPSEAAKKSLGRKMREAAFARQQEGRNKKENVRDLTRKSDSFGITKNYGLPHEWPLAQYTVTLMVESHGTFTRDMKNLSQPATTVTVDTDVGEKSVVYEDVFTKLSVTAKDGQVVEGYLQAVFIPGIPAYRVVLCSHSEEAVNILESVFEEKMAMSNFYQGKTLRFSREGVVFIQTPATTLEEAILPESVIKEYDLNVLKFLTDPKFSEKVKKRSLLLYGPPGTGKTTSVKAFFRMLRDQDVTCVWVSDDSFKRISVEQVFEFINNYLAPCLVVFEDIDLIAMDRKTSVSSIIGPLLSALNGVMDQEKPIVIVGTTNRPDVLDDAITRPCRFDRKLKIDYPDNKALAKMFERRTGLPADSEVFKQGELKKLTGAHVEEICNTADLLSKDQGRPISEVLPEAVKIVKDNFCLSSPSKLGFGGDEGGGGDLKEDCPGSPCKVSGDESPDHGDFYR